MIIGTMKIEKKKTRKKQKNEKKKLQSCSVQTGSGVVLIINGVTFLFNNIPPITCQWGNGLNDDYDKEELSVDLQGYIRLVCYFDSFIFFPDY